MSPRTTRHPVHIALIAAGGGALCAGIGGATLWLQQFPTKPHTSEPMLLAPMIGVVDTCIALSSTAELPTEPQSLQQSCTSSGGSAAALIESTLDELNKKNNSSHTKYPLGYTLPVPLLQLFKEQGTEWIIDNERVQRLVRTVRDNPRPLILYLFSTHFSAHAPIEKALARDPSNLAETQDGPIPEDSYYGSPIYNWSFASTETDITRRRTQAIQATLKELCKLPSTDIVKVRGVTLLGELHHLFPNFQSGMGFLPPYRITDYSPKSIQDFRIHLQKKYKNIQKLNRTLGSTYKAFTEIIPPSKDIRTEELTRFTEHIDPYAHGSLPITGWTFLEKQESPWIHIYRNGKFLGKTQANKGRQDVIAAKPHFGRANTGWRFDMDFKLIPPGIYRIDIFLEKRPGELMTLGTRKIAIMDARQSPPQPIAMEELPPSSPLDTAIEAHIDSPQEQASYYFNPLVSLWHEFRGQQIVRYLQYFNKIVDQSCLAGTPHYTHQIIPFTNPSWDTTKYAIDASLKPTTGMQLGVSLYGDASYRAFSKWYRSSLHDGGYGVTEFHPLEALSADSLSKILHSHANQGAKFLSFFLEPRWQGKQLDRSHNAFSFDPKNNQYGSATLYKSMQEALETP